MPLPLLAAGAIGLGGSLLRGLFGHQAKKKQAEQQRKANAELQAAQRRRFEAQRGYFDADQARRGARYDAANQAAGNVQGSLGAGAPNYQLSPDILERLKQPLPFYGSMGPDPSVVDPGAGLGYSFLSGLAGGLGNFGLNASLSGLAGESGSLAGTDVAPGLHPVGEAPGAAPEDRGNICQLYPTMPGCGGGVPLSGSSEEY